MIESRLDQNFALKSFYMQLNLAFRKKEEEKKRAHRKNEQRKNYDSTTIAEHETKRCYRRYGRDEYKFRRLLLLFSRSTSIFSPLPLRPERRCSKRCLFIGEAQTLYDRALIKRWKLPIKRPAIAGTRDRFENEQRGARSSSQTRENAAIHPLLNSLFAVPL